MPVATRRESFFPETVEPPTQSFMVGDSKPTASMAKTTRGVMHPEDRRPASKFQRQWTCPNGRTSRRRFISKRARTRKQPRRHRAVRTDSLCLDFKRLRFVLAVRMTALSIQDVSRRTLGVADLETLVADDTRMRADACRNLARVLEAASELFAAEGDGVSMEAIARRAGVGVGTIYRRFPTKKALGGAIVADHLDEVHREAVAAADAAPVEKQFCVAVTVLVDRASTHIDLNEALAAAGVDFEAAAAPIFLEIREFIARLLERAQSAGSIRPDVTVEDVVGLATGACVVGLEHGASSPTRLIAFALDGLRTRSVVEA